MAKKKGLVWSSLMLGIVLAGGASAVYYWSEKGGEGKGHAVRGLSLMGAGGEALADVDRLPATAQRAASSTAFSKARPRSPLPPRQAVEMAQQSGAPEDAFSAAQAIRRCRYMAGASRAALEKMHERGLRAEPKILAATMSPLESAERMCQELDDSMKAQYEPLLRKAMEGGVRGAAASWWRTLEAEKLGSAASETAVLDLLKRDATQCELFSFDAYKVAAFQFPGKFDANEVAAVHAATAQLYKDKKLKNNSLDKVMQKFALPWTFSTSVDENVVKDMTAKILTSCAYFSAQAHAA